MYRNMHRTMVLYIFSLTINRLPIKIKEIYNKKNI